MSSRRQKLLASVNWYLQSSLKHITDKSQVIDFNIEVVVTDRLHCITCVELICFKSRNSLRPSDVYMRQWSESTTPRQINFL